MKLYLIEFCYEVIEIAAESEQDAKIMASHCCNKSIKEILSVKYKGDINKPYFKTYNKKEQEFHNKRLAFYIHDNETIQFIGNIGHDKYFEIIHHPEFLEDKIRGYILEDHIMLYIGKDFKIPSQIKINKILLNNNIRGRNIKWIGLGCIKGKIGEEWEPQVKIILDKS